MSKQGLPISWFDFVILAVAVIGILRGRKRGMSQELLDFFMWLGMVAAGLFAYKPGSVYLVKLAGLSPMWANILVYVGAAMVVAFFFMLLKNALKDRIASSDIFGRLEYPLGMVSGMIRFFCLLIIALAMLNAPLVTEKEKQQAIKEQQASLGSSFFPSLGEIQDDVFVKSFTGPHIKKYLSFALIEPSSNKGQDLTTKDSAIKDKYKDVIPK